jgi:hypothetical protein
MEGEDPTGPRTYIEARLREARGVRGPSWTRPSSSRASWIRLSLAVLAVMALAGGLTVAFLPLATPAAGGTCGPGTSAESAIAAFFDPASIGAGSEPSASNQEEHYQWLAFVSECQSATNSQMLIAIALVALAILLGLTAIFFGRLEHTSAPDRRAHLGPGWYADPKNPGGWRWWDGSRWGPPSGW